MKKELNEDDDDEDDLDDDNEGWASEDLEDGID